MRHVSPALPSPPARPVPPGGATSSVPLTPGVRRAVGELHTEARGRAWAGRIAREGAARQGTALGTLPELPREAADTPSGDRLVGLLAQLRAETTRYVCGLRANGVRPEQMLVRVKAFVREAMAADGWHDPEATQLLTARVVAWSIAAYYDR